MDEGMVELWTEKAGGLFIKTLKKLSSLPAVVFLLARQ